MYTESIYLDLFELDSMVTITHNKPPQEKGNRFIEVFKVLSHLINTLPLQKLTNTKMAKGPYSLGNYVMISARIGHRWSILAPILAQTIL